jgi:flagellar biosynthesis protein FlhB
MPEQSFQDRTEQATPKKRAEAKKKGNIARSVEVNTAVIILVSALGFSMWGKTIFNNVLGMMQYIFQEQLSTELTVVSFTELFEKTGLHMMMMLAPFFLFIMVSGVAANLMQAGITFSSESITPKLEKINPLTGFKRFFSLKTFVDLLKNVAKMLVIGYVSYITLRAEFETFLSLTDQSVIQIVAFMGSLILKLLLRVGLLFLIIAALDYSFQRFDYEKNLKMSKQEIKDEMKQSEGDPQVKARIRAMQRDASRRQMLTDVAQADVVITNPTHYAVAIKYAPEENAAPIVLAKGMRKLAEAIKEIARENNVPIIERPLVARMLYKSAEVGLPIPFELYQVVAEILALVYQRKNGIR